MALKPISDHAKCEGLNCSYKQSCARYVRSVGAFQTWAAFYALTDDDCEYFEPLENEHSNDN